MLSLNIAGIPSQFYFNHESDGKLPQLRRYYRPFLARTPGGSAGCRFFVENGNGSPDCKFYAKLRDFPRHIRRAEPSAFGTGALHGFVWGRLGGYFDERSRDGVLSYNGNINSFGSWLRVIYGVMLARKGGFLLHAAGMVRNGRALVFPANSSGGKSTLSRLGRANPVLSDDIVPVAPRPSGTAAPLGLHRPRSTAERASRVPDLQDGAGYYGFSSPFRGDGNFPFIRLAAPVGGIFFLEKSARHRASPVPPREAFRRLMRHVVQFSVRPDVAGMVMDAVRKFCGCAPAYRLEFRPDAGVWDAVDMAMERTDAPPALHRPRSTAERTS